LEVAVALLDARQKPAAHATHAAVDVAPVPPSE
jgi:hypothetical protein